MKNLSVLLLSILFFPITSFSQQKPYYAVVIHGGAGYIIKENLSPDREKEITQVMTQALLKGGSILKNNGSAVDAVEAVIRILEDSPYFNAGKGAVFASNGKNELDASIMDGKTGKAGAIAGVTIIKNPISAARRVMENSPHVFLAYEGADQFAKEQGLEIVEPSYFFTQKQYDDLMKIQKREAEKKEKDGTVGCVALDKNGNLAAGTSTGGMANKKWGRIGDSPVIGAGTYADNLSCGISATGHGEFFIRNVVAYDISARMKYLNETLDQAASYVINDKLEKINGRGGVICMDKNGNISMPFNTEGMFRGYLKSGEKPIVLFFK